MFVQALARLRTFLILLATRKSVDRSFDSEEIVKRLFKELNLLINRQDYAHAFFRSFVAAELF